MTISFRQKVLIGLVVLLLTIKFSFETIVIDGSSMYPTFENGDHIVGCHIPVFFGLIKKGDIVCLNRPETGEIFVKRVSEIQDGTYWVLGDNLDFSEDSRDFGWLPKSKIRSIVYKLSE